MVQMNEEGCIIAWYANGSCSDTRAEVSVSMNVEQDESPRWKKPNMNIITQLSLQIVEVHIYTNYVAFKGVDIYTVINVH